MQYLCCKIPRTKIDNKKDTYFCIALTNIYEYFGSQVSKLICTSFGLGEIASLSDIFMMGKLLWGFCVLMIHLMAHIANFAVTLCLLMYC